MVLGLLPATVASQHSPPDKAIRELKEGYLIVRFPSYTAKTDTLKALISRSTDAQKKFRLEKELRETIEKRDTLLADYVRAFKNQYQFSKVAYFFDYDAVDLNLASYFNLEGERISVGDLSEHPLFYLYFERTAESRIDALVVYDRMGKIVPRPFPNNFSRGGLNFLFLKISEKNFPGWRVSRINKSFFKYWHETGGSNG